MSEKELGHEGATAIENGIEYDLDKIDNLGFIEHNGLFIIADRMNGVLRIERKPLTLTEISDELDRVVGE